MLRAGYFQVHAFQSCRVTNGKLNRSMGFVMKFISSQGTLGAVTCSVAHELSSTSRGIST